MTILGDIDVNVTRSNRRKSSLIIESDDEYNSDDYDTALGIKPRKNKSSICIADSDDGGYLSPLEDADEKKKRKHISAKKILPTGLKTKTPNLKPRKRRRSSARFLHLSERFAQDGQDEITETSESQEERQEKLGEMYRQAIRLNAANKINAGNSWGLNLIDNIDKFLGDDEDEDSSTMLQNKDKIKYANLGDRNDSEKEKRVNFTKASCTLDASVKIYSFRVDDVHLTSYKVLANLNRSDGGNKGDNDTNNSENSVGDEHSKKRQSSYGGNQSNSTQNNVNTIEGNPANLNISKLGAAYDIDPLFHKMSQKFDEGGAKGLLLVNLGVASDGCRIVLDSKEDSVADSSDILAPNSENDEDEKMEVSVDDNSAREDGLIEISSLRLKLQELLLYSPIDSVQLVPQLSDLRAKYAELEADGFIGIDDVTGSKSKRYANDEADEKAAEEVIHREAIERSRVSMGILNETANNASSLSYNLADLTEEDNGMTEEDNGITEEDNGNIFSPDDDDYGGGDDYEDQNENQVFDDFAAMDDNVERYSSSSFANANLSHDEFPTSFSKEGSSAINLLDSICSGEALNRQCSEYDYFNAAALEKLTSGNQWAGSAHWKKSERLSKKVIGVTNETPKDNKRKTKKNIIERTHIDLTSSCHECLHSLVKKAKAKSGRSTKTDQFRLSVALKQKYGKERNILPLDAGISVKQLSTLFMRPKACLTQPYNASDLPRKNVGFAGIDTYSGSSFNDGVDDSHDDCPGFQISEDSNDGNFVDNDDFVVKDLDDIRKVDKVKVAHATVAKKVDVRRLKKDLWTEVESKIAPVSQANGQHTNIASPEDNENKNESKQRNELVEGDSVLSFQDTVQKLTGFQKQEDVSLPFYFICMLHLANEKQLRLENNVDGLNDFVIFRDDDTDLDCQ